LRCLLVWFSRMSEPGDAPMWRETEGARAPPEIIRLVPPFTAYAASIGSVHTAVISMIFFGAAATVFAVFWPAARDSIESMEKLFLVILGCLIVAAMAIVLRVGMSHIRRKALAKYEAAFGIRAHTCHDDPLATAI